MIAEHLINACALNWILLCGTHLINASITQSISLRPISCSFRGIFFLHTQTSANMRLFVDVIILDIIILHVWFYLQAIAHQTDFSVLSIKPKHSLRLFADLSEFTKILEHPHVLAKIEIILLKNYLHLLFYQILLCNVFYLFFIFLLFQVFLSAFLPPWPCHVIFWPCVAFDHGEKLWCCLGWSFMPFW